MTVQEIQKAIDAIPAKMNAKGLRKPEVSLRLRGNQSPQAFAHWDDGKPGYQPNGVKFFYGDKTAAALISEVNDWIDSLPSADEAKRNQFISELGRVIDLGKDLGIDVEYVNPLRDTMKKLSENILTDNRSSRSDREVA